MPDKHGEPTSQELRETGARILALEEKSGIFSPEGKAAAERFFAHKKEHPEPVPFGELTPLQQRMQVEGRIAEQAMTQKGGNE